MTTERQERERLELELKLLESAEAELRDQTARQEVDLEQARAELGFLTIELADARMRLEERDREIARLREELRLRDSEVVPLQEEGVQPSAQEPPPPRPQAVQPAAHQLPRPEPEAEPVRQWQPDPETLLRALSRGDRRSARPAVAHLPARLEPGESIRHLRLASYGGDSGLLAATDRRILVLKADDPTKYRIFPYDQINSAQILQRRSLRRELQISSVFGEVVIPGRGGALEEIQDFIRARMRTARA